RPQGPAQRGPARRQRVRRPGPRRGHHPVRPCNGRRHPALRLPTTHDAARLAGSRRSRRPRPMTTQPLPETVPDWPKITATVRADATGSLTINGTEHPCQAATVEELRIGMIARCVTLAARLRRPVRVTAQDCEPTWTVAVPPAGIVQLVDEHGTIPAAGTLTVQNGRCRSCHRPQPVTATTCHSCGTSEPHRVETEPADGEAMPRDVSSDTP